MPSPAIELFDGYRLGASDGAKDERTRRFLVDFEPDQALNDPTLPPVRSIYPAGNPAAPFPLLLDRYNIVDVVKTPDHVRTIVECIYTNDRRGRLAPTPDRTRPGYASWEATYQDTQISFPTLIRYTLKVPGVTGAEADQPTLEKRIYNVSETLVTIEYSCVAQGLTIDHVMKVAAQNGRIHKLPGKQLLKFKAGHVHQTERDAWEITYNWIKDEGTRTPPQYVDLSRNGNSGTDYQPIYEIEPGRVLYSPYSTQDLWLNIDPEVANPDPEASYIRSPYHVIDYVTTSSLEPRFFQFLPCRYDPNGWRNLPEFNP